MTNRDVARSSLANSPHELHNQLLERYGPLIGGKDLRQALGFPSAAAFRQAALRGTLPVAVFTLPNRKGRFALTGEVSAWLRQRREMAVLPTVSTQTTDESQAVPPRTTGGDLGGHPSRTPRHGGVT